MSVHFEKYKGDGKMDKSQIVEIAKNYSVVVLNHFQVKKVILFGSQVNGNVHESSDIDIAVIVNQLEDDLLSSEAKLYKLRREIDLRIEPILLDEAKDASGFIQDILKDGEVIFEQIQ